MALWPRMLRCCLVRAISSVEVSVRVSEWVMTEPRWTPGLPRWWRGRSGTLSAVRMPCDAVSTLDEWFWIPRMLEVSFSGMQVMGSPFVREPPVRVPVMTVPTPVGENTRSTESLGVRFLGDCLSFWMRDRISDFRASSPSPVMDETGMMGASSRLVSVSSSRTSSWVNSMSSARSAFVRAMMTFSTPR